MSGDVVEASKSPDSKESPDEMEQDHNNDVVAEGEACIGPACETSGLQLKLRELERKKEQLVACQLKVEEDIQAVKRTMELISKC
jgi:hypothetical protein